MLTPNRLVCLLCVWEAPLVGEVEEHGTSITNVFTFRWPLSVGVASDAVTIFYLEQGDGGAFTVASRVEVYVLPAMLRSSVKQSCDSFFVTKES